MLLLIIAFTITIAGLLRNVLILMGLYKTPILATFEQYGDEYLPLPAVGMIGWIGVFVILAGVTSSTYFGPDYPMKLGVGILLLLL